MQYKIECNQECPYCWSPLELHKLRYPEGLVLSPQYALITKEIRAAGLSY